MYIPKLTGCHGKLLKCLSLCVLCCIVCLVVRCNVVARVGGGAGAAEPAEQDEERAGPLSGRGAARLRRALAARTAAAVVRNADQFGPLAPNTPVLAVLAGSRTAPLRRLLGSLARLAGVDELLLLVSHAHHGPALERAVRSVRYCMVLQVYYPHSLQLHPAGYPGRAGGARDAAAAHRKLHWWWSAHYAHERLGAAVPGGEHAGPVLLMPAGCCVRPDLASVLRLLAHAWPRYFPAVEAAALGGAPAPGAEDAALALEAWRPPLAAGLVLARAAWRRVVALRAHYCERADDDWPAALARVFEQFPRGWALALAVRAPRVLRVPADEACPRSPDPPGGWRGRVLVVRDRRGRLQLARREPAPARAAAWPDPRDLALCYHISDSFIVPAPARAAPGAACNHSGDRP